MLKIEDIARVCHEVNTAYCRALGDESQQPWETVPDWQRQSAINGVTYHLATPNSTPRDSHENWLKERLGQGWMYGPVKDLVTKTHPCCVPYEQLPVEQQVKDHLFLAVVRALEGFTEGAARA